jgi:acetolactate synthase-1/2/3 large subunit
MKGAAVIAQSLRDLGVRTVFCYPGGANLEMLDALSRVDIELLRTEHEQGAVFAAQGYARASGRIGVCLATSGPGATNLVTGIADAHSDSIPILAITGNVATRWLGRNAFQEVDIVAITTPITKLSRQVREPDLISGEIGNAARVALRERPGPVLLDFPKDIQQAEVAWPIPASFPDEAEPVRGVDQASLTQLQKLLAECKKPVIYAGGGIIAAGGSEDLSRLASALQCPVALTLMGLGAVPSGHPLFLGPLGMHGAYAANAAVNEADLVLALGVRFDDRVIGDPVRFAANAVIVHIDIDARELSKNKPAQLGIRADLRFALKQLLDIAKSIECRPWRDYLQALSRKHPLRTEPASGRLSGPDVLSRLAQQLPPETVLTTGVGQHQMWAMQRMHPSSPRSLLSSSGFGTMGFGLPAAIGAKKARPDAVVVDIDGDGSLNMVVNELATCRRYGIGVKIVVINNQWLGMVRQWQDMIYAGNRVTSSLNEHINAVKPASIAAPYPDFVTIASGYAIRAERVQAVEGLDSAIGRLLKDPNEPYLLDVMVDQEDNVFPMIPSGSSYRETLFGFEPGRAADT